MKINRKGITRLVIEFDKVVVKIPNFMYQWSHFLQGVLSNIQENKTWKYNEHNQLNSLLCPVLWCSWGGWILIMKKVDETFNEENMHLFNIEEHVRYFVGDDSVNNYGILDNKVVKLDYGQLN